MKQLFSTSWLSSMQVRKQRKFRRNAPLHVKQKFLSAQLSEDLRKKHGMRSMPVRKDDEVLVMKGSFAKKKGKVTFVDVKKGKVAVESVTRKKSDGSNVNILIHPSKLQIQSLSLNDKKRMKTKKSSKKENN